MSTRFILVRHGETDWNRSERFRGRSHIGLNAEGHLQAQRLAERIAASFGPIASVYTSPLPRASETADPIALACGLTVEHTADLLDIDYGTWEGLSQVEAQERDPQLYETWLKRPGRVRFPGGESVRQVRIRIENLLNELSEKHLGETMVLVSHRITCHVILCFALGLTNDALWRVRQDVACLNVLERREESFTLALMNDTAHLRI